MEKLAAFFSLDRLYNYLGLLCGGLAAALGGWDVPLQALVGAMALDYASGVLVAVKERNLSSAVGFAGLARKLTIFLIVIVAGSLDALTGQQNVCRAAAVAFYFVNEAVSLLENAAKLGLPVPEKIVDVLAQLKGEK